MTASAIQMRSKVGLWYRAPILEIAGKRVVHSSWVTYQDCSSIFEEKYKEIESIHSHSIRVEC